MEDKNKHIDPKNFLNKNLYFIVTSITTLVSLALLIVSFCMPPQGVIDKSVLIAFAELALFISTIMWIHYHHIYQVHDKVKKKE
jgi:hypothetical protein